MKPEQTDKHLLAFKAVLLGLMTTQIIATVHVYISNRDLYQNLQLVLKAGYLSVPNSHVIESLQKIGLAFTGGIFFTLTLGTALSILTIVLTWAWDRLLGRNRIALLLLIIAWLIGIAGVNANGFSPMPTAYVVIVPPVVFGLVLCLLPDRTKKNNRIITILFLAAPLLLFAVWLPLAKGQIFLDIRDNILLSNPLGRKINDFYYDYTLYAAQAFKSLDQKTIKTCRLELKENESRKTVIEKILLLNDYLVIEDGQRVDLSVEEQDGKLIFAHRDKKILTTSLNKFAVNPNAVLKDFSARTDRYGLFRSYVFISLVVGSPIFLYIMLHGILSICLSLLIDRRKAALLSVIFCLLVGIGAAIPLYMTEKSTVDRSNFSRALGSELLRNRLAALQYMSTNGLNHARMTDDHRNWLQSPSVAERYWYVKAMGADRSPEAGSILMAALNDPNTNVVCMAYYSLGKRGDTSVIDAIIKRIQSSDDWYEQFYAYRALKNLGWLQAK